MWNRFADQMIALVSTRRGTELWGATVASTLACLLDVPQVQYYRCEYVSHRDAWQSDSMKDDAALQHAQQPQSAHDADCAGFIPWLSLFF